MVKEVEAGIKITTTEIAKEDIKVETKDEVDPILHNKTPEQIEFWKAIDSPAWVLKALTTGIQL